MRVTVIFPKWQSYSGKGLDEQRAMNEIYRRYLDMLVNSNCDLEIILEDVQAVEIFKLLGYQYKRIVTCLNTPDLLFLTKQNNCDAYPDFVFDMHDSADQCDYGSAQQGHIDLGLIHEDKEKYMAKRIYVYRKRLRYAMDHHMMESKATLVFRLNNANDRVSHVGDLIRVGDGKLYMEVDMTTGSVVSYYGGVYVTEDMLPVILSA